MADHYLGNPLLKKANTVVEYTEDQVLEFAKCQEDPLYFIRNYINIVTLDHGLQPIDLYPFQEKMISRFHNHRFNICKLPRQSGKCLNFNTKIRLRNKKTKEVIELTLGDFYARLKAGK